jgi:hypothetical protein
MTDEEIFEKAKEEFINALLETWLGKLFIKTLDNIEMFLERIIK